MIIDSIKHISAQVSSVREVLPGREYFIPQTACKLNPLEAGEEEMAAVMAQAPEPVGKALYSHLQVSACHGGGILPSGQHRILDSGSRAFRGRADSSKPHFHPWSSIGSP